MAADYKTNVMRLLDRAKVPYRSYTYESDGAASGVEVAAMLGRNPAGVFKTLVTRGKSGKYYVFMIPVAEELDLKKAAAAAEEKAIEMIKSKELLPLTGYIHGGCSPIGMKKPFFITVHASAQQLETIVFSAGKIGYQVELTPADLQRMVNYQFADVIV